MNKYDFLLERRLKEISPDLHQRFSDTVFVLQQILSNYKLIFPDFTDHTELHTLNIIEFCNNLIGEQIVKLNADEIYVLLLGCYFHDTGMGISHADFEEFSKQINFGNYFDTHVRDNYPEIVRNFHQEFSGLFLRKYAKFFEFPSEEHLFAIIQISRGHRKTDLNDEKEYPINLKVPGGNTICLPYLSALVRLADEIDVFMKHEAVRGLEITDKAFIMDIKSNNQKIINGLNILAGKMKKTLDYCRSAVNNRTSFKITQEDVIIKNI